MDSDDATQYKFAAERILDDLQSNFGDEFKAYFFGDPYAIPISQLPCLIVDLDSATQDLGPTGFDRISQKVIVKVVLNKRDDFAGDMADSVTLRKLITYMEARDATTKQWKSDSVLGIVRKYLTLDNTMLNMSSLIQYGTVQRSQEVLTAESQLTITTDELVQVDNRS